MTAAEPLPVDLRTPFTEPPASRASLGTGEVHLWWGRIDPVESLDSVRGWLSDEERCRGERFRREEDAHAYLFRRAFLRRVLAFHTGAEPGALCFTCGAFGKPALAWPVVRLSFNASRSGAWALVAVADGRALGVDLERRDARLADPEELSRLARRVLTPEERAALEALEPRARLDAFLRLWTRKEAALKLLGTGLSREPDTLGVGLVPAPEPRPLVLPEGGPALVTLDLQAPADHCASLVAAAAPGEALGSCLRTPAGLRRRDARTSPAP